MGIFVSFAPWILYWVLISNNTFEEAAVVALVATVVLIGWGMTHGTSPKILDYGTLAWFLILMIIGLSADDRFVAEWSYVLSNFALAAIMVGSILVGQPFTRQYARDTVDPQFWNTPTFLKSTLVIAWFWVAMMLVMAVSTIIARENPSDEMWWNWIIPIGAFVAAIKFSAWYPDRVREEAGLSPRSEA